MISIFCLVKIFTKFKLKFIYFSRIPVQISSVMFLFYIFQQIIHYNSSILGWIIPLILKNLMILYHLILHIYSTQSIFIRVKFNLFLKKYINFKMYIYYLFTGMSINSTSSKIVSFLNSVYCFTASKLIVSWKWLPLVRSM